MCYDSSLTPTPGSLVPANYGVRMTCEADGFHVAARNADDRYVPRPLPPLPAALLEAKAGWLRAVWRARARCSLFLLYLDLGPGKWHALLPPQMSSEADVRYNPRFPGGGGPGPGVRLAGSLFTCPHEGSDELLARVPPFDGLHFVMSPARAWLYVQALAVLEGTPQVIASAHDVIADECARYSDFEGLGERQWLVEKL